MEEVKRPGSGTVLGILNIIFCSFGVLGLVFAFVGFGILNAIFGAFPIDSYASDYDEAVLVLQAMRSFFSISLVITIIQGALNGVGLAGGISLLKSGRKSILLCNMYAIGTIVIVIAGFILNKYILHQMLDNLMLYSDLTSDELMGLNIAKRIIPGFTGTISIFFGSAYPVVVLSLLNRKKVRDYYASGDIG